MVFLQPMARIKRMRKFSEILRKEYSLRLIHLYIKQNALILWNIYLEEETFPNFIFSHMYNDCELGPYCSVLYPGRMTTAD